MSEAKIIDITPDLLNDAVDCQVKAFLPDPIFEYFFPDPATREQKMRIVFDSGCRYRFMTGLPCLGLLLDGQIVGVANVTTPDEVTKTEEVDQLWEQVGIALGPEADERFEKYQALKAKHSPAVPHHYLVSLSVRPGFQGQGLGGQLLEAVCRLADVHPTSQATVLDTGTELNVKFYKKHGFQTIGEGDLDGVPGYWMLRNST